MAKHYSSLSDFFARSGVQQQEIARRLGVTSATISRWVSGVNFPQQPEMLLRLHAETGVPVEALVREAAALREDVA